MKSKVALVGILTIALATLAVSSTTALPIPPGYETAIYFDPDPSSVMPGENITVQLKLNTSVDLDGVADWIYFDPNVVNITNVDFTGTAFPDLATCSYWGNYVKISGGNDSCCKMRGEILVATLTLQGINPGTSQLYHSPDDLEVINCDLEYATAYSYHGNITCLAPQETFSKELVEGWNLISLPLYNATDMTVENIINRSLGGKYDALYKYDASAHGFVPLNSTDIMKNGVGYFIHMTEDATWTYTGSAYTEMSIPLEPGLNLIGWLNCTNSTSDILAAGDYWYATTFNATAQNYTDTFNPVADDVFNRFTTIEPGMGFWVSAKHACWLNVSV